VKDSAIIYRNFIDAVEMLPAEMQGEAYKAYLKYSMDGEEYTGDNFTVAALFMVFKARIDADKEAYEATLAARSEAGRKGADKRWQNSKAISEDSKTMANDSKAMANDSKGIANDGKGILPDGKAMANDSKHMAKMADIDIDIDIKEKDVLRTSKEKAPRHKHGSYNHVLLTDDEYRKLFESFGEPKRTELINKLDEYCQETGKTYKDYYLVIAKKDSWVQREVMKPKRPGSKAEKEARRGTERGTDYDAAVRDFAMNPPEDMALPFNDPPEDDALAELMAM